MRPALRYANRAFVSMALSVLLLAGCAGQKTTIGVPGNDQLRDPNASAMDILDARERTIRQLEAEKAEERQRLIDHSAENRRASARASQRKIDMLQRRIDRLRAPEPGDIPAITRADQQGDQRSIRSIEPVRTVGPMEKQYD